MQPTHAVQDSLSIDNYPELVISELEEKLCSSFLGKSEKEIITSTVEILLAARAAKVPIWIEVMNRIHSELPEPQKSFEEIESFLRDFKIDLGVLFSELAILGVSSNQPKAISNCLIQLAESTQLVSHRFLSAWFAFNKDLPAVCIEECEKLEQPYGDVMTLQGQAFLDLGDLANAVDCFQVAIQLLPNDPLPCFQLARAFWCSDSYSEALEAIQMCLKIAKHDLQAHLFHAMIAKKLKKPEQWLQALSGIEHLRKNGIHHPELDLACLDLCLLLKDREKLTQNLCYYEWEEIDQNQAFIGRLSDLLKTTHLLGWHDLSVAIIDAVQNRTSPNLEANSP